MPDAWDNGVIKRKRFIVFKKCIVSVKKWPDPSLKALDLCEFQHIMKYQVVTRDAQVQIRSYSLLWGHNPPLNHTLPIIPTSQSFYHALVNLNWEPDIPWAISESYHINKHIHVTVLISLFIMFSYIHR